jgi:hypothetical protein
MALKKIGLVAASAICSINLWTGAPLFAVWVGSKVQGNLNNLSMTAVFSVVVVLAALVFLLAWVLTWTNAKYDDLTGRHPAARHTSPWLRSLRDEREEESGASSGSAPWNAWSWCRSSRACLPSRSGSSSSPAPRCRTSEPVGRRRRFTRRGQRARHRYRDLPGQLPRRQRRLRLPRL